MNKKGIELSINFLVVIIISIVMLSMGILLTQRYFSTATNIKSDLDQQTMAHIDELLDSGDIITIPAKRKTIGIGGNDIFGLGVLNINENPTSFNVNIQFSKLIKNNAETAVTYDPNKWLRYENSFSLNHNDKKTVLIRVQVPKKVITGTYIFNVAVLPYERVTKLYVIVP